MPADAPSAALRFAVIGCGSIGKRHLSNLIRLDVAQLGAFDFREDRRDEVRQKFPGVRVADTSDALWDLQPDVALVTVPTRWHVPVALEAVEHGCHLFIEKPLSDRLDPALDHLVAEAHARERVTLVGCNVRFHPGLKKVKQLLDAQAIGRVVAARVEAGQYLPDWHPWEDYRLGYSARRDLGGGVVLDGIHELDYLTWWLGDVDRIACMAGRLGRLGIDTEDTAAMLLQFAGGPIGEVHVDYLQRAYSRSCHLIGDEGTIRWDFDSGVRWYAAATKSWTSCEHPAGWEINDMYLDEMRHFLRCLEGAEQPVADLASASRTLAIALAAKASAETKRMIECPPAGRPVRPEPSPVR
jgi:predicted dehydrogenase